MPRSETSKPAASLCFVQILHDRAEKEVAFPLNIMQKSRPFQVRFLNALLTTVIFAGDLFVPLEITGGLLYVCVVLLTLWLPERRSTPFWAGVSSLLIVLGHLAAPPAGDALAALVNRGLSLFAVWVTAALLIVHRRAQQALKESEARVRAILETTAEGIITVDEAGRVASMNAAAEQIFGLRSEEVVGSRAQRLFPWFSDGDLARFVQVDAARRGRPSTQHAREVVGRGKDGSLIPLDIAVSKVHVNGQDLYTAVVRDMTEQRRLEWEVLRLSEESRRRIGQDLSEGLGQMLTGIGLINNNLSRRLKAENHPCAEDAAQLTDLIGEADRHTRDLTEHLVPVARETSGLSIALERLARQSEEHLGIVCRFDNEEDVRVPDPTVATHLFQIAQEAVHGAVRHRKATRVHMDLGATNGDVRLRIQDNGLPLSEAATLEDVDFGLRIIQYRARRIGAALEVQSDPEEGTTVLCRFPKDASRAGEAGGDGAAHRGEELAPVRRP